MHKRNKNLLNFAKREVTSKLWYATDNAKFTLIKVLYYLSVIYLLFNELVLLAFYWLKIDNLSKYQTATEQVADFRSSASFLGISVLLIIISTVLFIKKWYIPFAIINVGNYIYSFKGLLDRSLENYLQYGIWRFWTKYGAILIFLAIITLIVLIAHLIERKAIKEEYDSLVAAIYNKHVDEGEDDLDAATFEKYLNEYSGEDIFVNYPHLKKSVRKRKEKLEIIDKRKEELERIHEKDNK